MARQKMYLIAWPKSIIPVDKYYSDGTWPEAFHPHFINSFFKGMHEEKVFVEAEDLFVYVPSLE
jgi:hypothetical protein